MKPIPFLFLLALSLLWPTTAAAEKPWEHGPLQVSANHHYLMHRDGTPFFWQGETAWLMPQKLNRQEVQYYLNCCHEAGYNMVQVQLMDNTPSVNAYGQLSLIDGWDFSAIDRKGIYGYWDHVDYIVDQAAQQGIYIGMVAIWGSQVKAGRINEEQARCYGRFLAQRYAQRPNIIWIMGGDIQGSIHPEVWTALATTIKAVDDQHLMTFHPRGRHTSAQFWAGAAWIDFHTYQSGHRRYGQRMGNENYPIADGTEEDTWMYVDSTWVHDAQHPVLDDEPVYEDIPQGLHFADEPRWQACDVRRYAYWDVFAGACGHTYGHNSIMQFYRTGEQPAYFATRPWTEALRSPGFHQMKYLRWLMLSFPYFERVPDQRIIARDNGTRYEHLVATRGHDYLLVYNYTGRTMTIDLTRISGERKRVWWFCPIDGSLTYLGEHANQILTFRPHAVTDGVLIATDAAAQYLQPNQSSISATPLAAQPRDLNE